MMTTMTLSAGDRIVVRSNNPARDGFVTNVGRFLRNKPSHDGVPRFFEYAWHNLTATRAYDDVTIAPFSGTATDDAAGRVA